ncbi:TadE/TadG family type IV pilus assembly protein [Cellulomonas sp.]|uniref:TadE/TadG family type IV pilus assembly protein n=1 Tax=Cellulomonas sp. TaxID=40001 RepID=UPI003BADB413
MRRLRERLLGDDRGSSAIEILGVMPIVVIVILAAIQVVAVSATTHAANQAVRDGARAMSLGRSVPAAIDASLPNGLGDTQITYPAGAVRIEVPVPRIAIFPSLTVTREATMPRMVP